MLTIETQRLKMLPFTLDAMKAATLASKEPLEAILGATVPASWPGPDLADALPIFAARLEKDPTAWSGLIIHKADQILIGDMGMMGGPDDQGMVEIGYSIIPEYRNQGYASEMAHALVQWAIQEPSIKVISAKTLKDNAPSIKVITRAGLHCVGEQDEWLLWELHLNN
jgi:RimJ/RimL family protein N-acetyltransferase